MKTIFDEGETKTVYEKLHMYSRKQIDKGIAELTRKERDFLYFRYDGDLDNHYINPDFNKEDDKYFYFFILPRIKEKIIKKSGKTNDKVKQIKQDKLKIKSSNLTNKKEQLKPITQDKRIKTIYQVCDKFQRELVDEVLNELNEKDKALLLLMNGSDLNNPVRDKNIDAKTKTSYKSTLIPKIKRKLEKKSLNLNKDDKVVDKKSSLESDEIKINYEELKKFIINELRANSYIINNLINNLTILEIEVIYMKLQDISNKQISNKLGITTREVTRIIKEFYNKYRDIYMNSISEEKTHTKKLVK